LAIISSRNAPPAELLIDILLFLFGPRRFPAEKGYFSVLLRGYFPSKEVSWVISLIFSRSRIRSLMHFLSSFTDYFKHLLSCIIDRYKPNLYYAPSRIITKVSHFRSRRQGHQWTPQGERVTGVCSSLAAPVARLNFHHSW
jgi:hypothetical protein